MKNLFLILSFVLLAFTACNSDDNNEGPSVSVAFAEASYNLTSDVTPVQIKFSAPAPSAGSITITFAAKAAVYTTDFTTVPAVVDNKITLPFAQNATSVEFNFNRIKKAIGDEVKNVVFTISSSSINANIAGNKTIQLNFNETASLGTALAPEVGGPFQQNQVYVDLSSGKMTKIARTSWDLGFYSGTDAFRVVLNSSVKMSAKVLTSTNIDEVQAEDETMIISQGSGNLAQIDEPTGDLTKVVIADVSATDANNKVYLINMGSNPGTAAPAVGSEGSASGTSRGWKKVRILRSGSDYKVQYADIKATTHDEIIISKNSAYNFTFLSLIDKKTVNVEPQKNQWDLNFTTFTNSTQGPNGLAPYHFPDFVLSNLKGDAFAYQVLVSATVTFDNFTLANVDTSKFTKDQRNIGSNWRGTSAMGPGGIPVSQFVLRTDRFFVVKDAAGNVYKLKFTGGANDKGERGFPKFQYVLLK
ncbi:HmuY family protein [Flavobacterium sp. FlaQc-50]|jgi:hypothetical protein|uniref:HmuY family protein n=1 Tax=unclassified Flavobacterium TaxID=196869 RepID=UPI003757F939